VYIISLPGYNQDTLYKNNELYELLAEANWLKKKDKTTFSYRWKLFLCAIPGLVRFFTMAPGVHKKYEGIKKKMAKTDKTYEELKQMRCPAPDDFYWIDPYKKCSSLYGQKQKECLDKISNCERVYEKLKPKKKLC